MSAVREKSKLTSLLDDLSIESSAAVRTPRERSCDEVLKYSVIGKLDVEKTRMRVQNELAIMTERKPAKLYRDIASAAPSISRRAQRSGQLDDKENRIRQYEPVVHPSPARVLRRLI